ncbi:MAG: hypothetical protein ACYDDF_05250 [Thermoplasmatota archaeon]
MTDLEKARRRPTSVSIDPELWNRFLAFSLQKGRKSKMGSHFLELAITEYMAKHERDDPIGTSPPAES